DTSTTTALLRSLAIPAIMGTGAALQALAGASLIRKFAGFPDPLIEHGRIARFLLIAGPLSCVTTATIAQITLIAFGAIQVANAPISWLTWWVGDTVGVLIVAPILLTFLAEPADVWRERRLTLALPLGITLIAAIVVF